jgi:vesicle transport through interaction with t-SNAREs protein 1
MSTPLDTDAGLDGLFGSYEAELKLVQADIAQKLDQIPELSGEPRKASLAAARRAVEEADELLAQMRLEKQNMPSSAKNRVNSRLLNYASDVDQAKRRLRTLESDRTALFGDRYTDNPSEASRSGDSQYNQRQQLLGGTERLERSTQRLKASQALANETEAIGAAALADLHTQRETIVHTQGVLGQSEGYVDRSVNTLRGMARRY